MYNKILQEIVISDAADEFEIEEKDDVSELKLNRPSPKKLYEHLTKFVIQTAKSINENSSSAIYIIDPNKNNFTLQNGNTSEFSDSISLNNELVKKYITNKKKLHQKDHPREWSDLFFGQNWRGSECAIFSPININGNIAGFIMTRLDHFNKATDKETNLFAQLSEYVSFSLSNLESLEQYMVGEDSKILILEILSNLDFKSDSQNIFNQFKYLIRTFFNYDRVTISTRKESENRRKHDKGVTSTIKLVDGDKDEFIEGSDFPTNGSLQGLPVISSTYFQTSNWRRTHQNMFRFKSSESEDYKYKSVLGAPIIIEGESRGSIILEKNEGSSFSSQELADVILIGQVLGSALHWKFEYEKITESGLSIQIDCPDLALSRHMIYKDISEKDFLKRANKHVEVLNNSLSNIDPTKVRMHICWGNYEGPHTHDIGLDKIIEIAFKANVNKYLIESANPRHAHEWEVFESIKLPKDKIIIPGVIESTSNFIEHPDVIKHRILAFSKVVEPNQLMAGTDCGFSTFAGYGNVDEEIVYKKLEALVAGAKLASKLI